MDFKQMSEEWKTLAEQIAELQRQLVEVTRERDYFKAACEMADALRNQPSEQERRRVRR